MSDRPLHDSWYRGSDGKWYPPADDRAVAPGWHRDPHDPRVLRWWDGSQWTDQTWTEGPALAAVPAQADGWRYTSLSPEQATHAVAAELTRRGFTVLNSSGGMVVAEHTFRREPSAVIAFLWFLLCIVPMFIYLLTARSEHTVSATVVISARDPGSMVSCSGSSQWAYERSLEAIAVLPV